MLNDYPQTLDVLLETSPHFNKLKNKILRKTLASRVNVEQAAGIAGVDLNALLFKLNKSINPGFELLNQNAETNMKVSDEVNDHYGFIENIDNDKLISLDVRPIIDSGKDPFLEIMTKVKSLKDDEIFLLINSFEPIPLYSMLGKKGFEHKTTKEEEVYKIYFYKKSENNLNDKENNSSKLADENLYDYDTIKELDVRGLEPPEPMVKVLETLQSIDNKTILVVHHHREPLMLYPKLEERGFTAVANKIKDDYFKIIITKKEEAA